jgi:hypothetical protein
MGCNIEPSLNKEKQMLAAIQTSKIISSLYHFIFIVVK